MTPEQRRRGLRALLIGLATLLAACGSAAGAAPAVVAPSPSPLPTLVAAPSPSSTPTQGTGRSDPLKEGEDIFLRTAGGVGCQYCHGEDGRGSVGPSIRGKSAEAIRQALGTVLQMSIIELTDEEIEAVAAYLKYLESQP